MISKLPGWIWLGGTVLAFIAGMINAVGFVGFQHQGITHLTGNVTLLGIDVVDGERANALHLLGVIGAFLLGCIVSGFVVQDSTLKLGRRYGVALLLESALLFVSAPLLGHSNALGYLFASCACGLQNGMVSTYSGAVLRTTHVTGIITDLGIFLGQLLHGGIAVDLRRVRLCVLLLGSFLIGSMVGAIGFARFGYATLYGPAALTGCAGLVYGAYTGLRPDSASR